MPRLYGRKNFTRTKTIQKILGPYERPRRAYSTKVRFDGLPATSAAELLTKLPAAQQGDTACPAAPSFAELVEAGLGVSGATFGGFRVDPDDLGERITLTRIVVPNESRTKEALDTLVAKLREHQHRLTIGADGSVVIDWEPTRRA